MRLRKSVKIAPGIRLNVTKTGIGLSAGVRGARYSVHSSGRTTRTVGMPGTGGSYLSVSGRGHAGTRAARAREVARPEAPVVVSGAQAAPFLPKAGFFASPAEKRYREGLVAYLTGNKPAAIEAFDATLAADPAAMSAHLLAAIAIDTDVDMAAVIRHLEAVVTTHATFPDRYQAKFLPAGRSEMQLDVKITELISARVPFDATGAALLLAEAYQQSGRLEEAIGLVQQLHDANASDSAIQLSLADLLFADGDYDAVVEVTAHARNDDDLTVALIHMRAAALSALGHQTAALVSFRDALAKTANRDAGLLATVRYDRALALEQAGEKAKARADYERLYANEPGYRDVRERLAALG
jgi:tetratricopeptide (TPR) repeat protein